MKSKIVAGGLLVLATYAMYYVSSYETVHDTSWWVSTGLDRMLFPGMITLWFAITGVVGLYAKPPVES